MIYKIEVLVKDHKTKQVKILKTFVYGWKIVNKFLKNAFKEYGDIMLGYKIESINV